MKYTFTFEGELTVEAESEEEAYELADDLLGVSAWTADNCDEISIDEINLVDVFEDDEEEE